MFQFSCPRKVTQTVSLRKEKCKHVGAKNAESRFAKRNATKIKNTENSWL